MTDNAARALEILNMLGEQISALRNNPKRAADLGKDGTATVVQVAHGAATVHALLDIADAIRESARRGECGSENPRRHETCMRPTGHDGRHQSTAGSVW